MARFLLFLSLLGVGINCPAIPPTASDLPDMEKLWDYSDPVITELKFREVLADIDFEQEPAYCLELRTQIARTLGLQGKYTEANNLLDQVETDLKPDYTIAGIRYLLERGRVLNSAGMAKQSLPFFKEAWESAQLLGADYYAVDAAHMLGIAEQPVNQLLWSNRALTLAETSADPRTRGWLGALYNNIGWTYHDLGRYKEALLIFEKALRWRQMQAQVREIQIADWSVARVHRSLGHIDLALQMQLNLEQEIAESGGTEDGYVFEEIAECLLLEDEPEAAAPYFLKAWTVLSQDSWMQEHEAPRLARLKQLGQ